MQFNWEKAHSAALRDCLEKGMTFSEVARTLNERFGTAYSRNATLGRARRMGLSSPARAGRLACPKSPKPTAVRLRKRRERVISGIAARADVGNRAATLQLRCVAIKPRHISLVELEACDCRYPYGGDAEGEPITFCGHPRREGSSYCVSHFHLTRGPEQAGERAPAKVVLRLVEAA
jgi:GcrA cell cycle regulator